MRVRLRKSRELIVATSIVMAVFVASPLHLPLNNPNEGVRVYTVKALVEQHTFAIDDVQRDWGYIDDKSTKDGHLYSSKAPLLSLLGAAAYGVVHVVSGDLSRIALTRLCRGAADAVPCLAFAFVLWSALRRRVRDPVVADVVVVGSVLGTGALASMNVFAGHALALLAPAAALTLVTPPLPIAAAPAAPAAPDAQAAQDVVTRARRVDFAIAGVAIAAAVCAEYPALAACIPIVGLALFTIRRGHSAAKARVDAVIALVAGAMPIVVVTAAAQWAMFGAPWRTGYSYLENKGYQGVVAGSLFGIGAPKLDVLATVLFTPEVGLFFFSPFLVAGLAYAFALAFAPKDRADVVERRSLGIAIVASCLLMFLFIAGFRGWRGGWSVGPRYISEVAGVLAVPTALAFDALARRHALVARSLLAGLVAIGILHSGIAGAFFPHLSDVFANPVYEMMLPVVARGFSPDSVPLALGMTPIAAATVVVILLFVPLVAATAASLIDASAAVASTFVALLLAVMIGPHLAHTDDAKAALEARRMLDNWRPDEGDPYLVEVGDHDVRTLLAIDRARFAWPIAHKDGCAPLDTPRARSRPIGGPLAVIEQELGRRPNGLVVVPNRFALALGGVRASRHVFAVDADLARETRLGLPCTGDIYAVRGKRDPPLPPQLHALTVRDRWFVVGPRENAAARDDDDRLEILVLDRRPASATAVPVPTGPAPTTAPPSSPSSAGSMPGEPASRTAPSSASSTPTEAASTTAPAPAPASAPSTHAGRTSTTSPSSGASPPTEAASTTAPPPAPASARSTHAGRTSTPAPADGAQGSQ